MITFKCNHCLFEFSEADKAWDKAIKTGSCPKCRKKHSELDLNNQINGASTVSSELNDAKHLEIPKWIKVFGWGFIILAIATPLIPVILLFFNQPIASYGIFGLHFQGSPLSPMALLISGVFVALGTASFGLLFHKKWGIKACLIMAYISVGICILTMSLPIINAVVSGSGDFNITFRLELLLLIPYIKWLQKVASA